MATPPQILRLIKDGKVQIGTPAQRAKAEFHICGQKTFEGAAKFTCVVCKCVLFGDPKFSPNAKKICVKCFHDNNYAEHSFPA